MQAEPRLRVDERALGAGTTVRFVLLVVLLLVASASTALSFAKRFTDSQEWVCALAAGWDPTDVSDHATMSRFLEQREAYEACLARYAPAPLWWVPLAGTLVFVVLAVGLFFVLPAWKLRRFVPLATVDHDRATSEALAGLVATAGLRRAPRFVVDPTAASTGAVVFGRNGRPVVALHVGLLVRRPSDPEGFRTVVLHELAHIRNGDVTLTHATVALWRVFLFAMLLPDAAWYAKDLVTGTDSPLLPAYLPGMTRGLLIAALLVVLIHLARADVLRVRELHADLTALRWGADPRGWAAADAPSAGGAFVGLWRTHPSWALRRASLDDPTPLFGVPALTMFLAGTAAALINYSVSQYLKTWPSVKQYRVTGWWADQGVVLVAAALVTGVVGFVLWRAVAHAVLTGDRMPTGVGAGLWLGSGVVVGELVVGQQVIDDWLPPRPWFLVLVVAAGVAFTWWVTQCARLWAVTWPGRTLRPPMLLVLAAGCVLLAVWFAWWLGGGVYLVFGSPIDLDTMRDRLTESFPGPAADRGVVTAVAVMIPMVATMTKVPLVLAAVTLAWLVPLLAWLVRPVDLRWVRGVAPDGDAPPAQPPPRLRRVLSPGLLGGVVAWALVAVTLMSLHGPEPASGGLPELWLIAWVFVAVLGGVLVAGVFAPGPYRLLVTLTAAQVAALLGLAGAVSLLSVDGCVPALSVFETTCGLQVDWAWSTLQLLVTPVLVLATVLAVLTAAVRALLHRARRSAPAPVAAVPTAGMRVRRAAIAVLCAAAAVVATTEAVTYADRPSEVTAEPSWAPADTMPVSARTRQFQVIAWARVGGATVLDRLTGATSCDAVRDAARQAEAYFRVPDTRLRPLWEATVAQARKARQSCEDDTPPETTRMWAEQAAATARVVRDGIDAVRRGGEPVTTAPPATGELDPAAWHSRGAGELLTRFTRNRSGLHAYLDEVRGKADPTELAPFCVEVARIVKDAEGYFRVRDPRAQELWETFVAQARTAGEGCARALVELDTEAFRESLQTIDAAVDTGRALEEQVRHGR